MYDLYVLSSVIVTVDDLSWKIGHVIYNTLQDQPVGQIIWKGLT